MRHQNSVFHSVQKHVPWDLFDRLVEEHEADARVRRLTTKDQFVALLYGQLSGAAGLREIVTGLESHAKRLYHVGADVVRRSTLSDSGNLNPWPKNAPGWVRSSRAGTGASCARSRRKSHANPDELRKPCRSP